MRLVLQSARATFLGLHLKKRKEEAEKEAASASGSAVASTPVVNKKPKMGIDSYPSVDGRFQSESPRVHLQFRQTRNKQAENVIRRRLSWTLSTDIL